MIKYEKFSSADRSRPGRKGLIRRSAISSVATDSSPSRRNSGLNPISSGSPENGTGSDSFASPTSCVCAEIVTSPSANRSRSGEFRWAITAARRVGPSGSVLATDISPEMLEFGKSRAAEMALQNVDFREMDAEHIDLPESSFDAILCRFGLMFLPNLDAALRSMLRLLVPGGRLAAAVWGPPDKVQSSGVARSAVLRVLELSAPPAGTPDPYSLSDTAAFEQKLTAASFTNVHTEQLVVKYEWPSPDAYVEFAEDLMAPIRSVLAKQPADIQARIRASIREAASRYATADGTVHMESEAILAVAQRG